MYSLNSSFHNLGLLFENIVENYGNKPSIKYENQNYSYLSINALANQICNFLLENNVSKQDVVGVFNSKEAIGYATMLACLKIGAIYTNIDEENPEERLKKIFHTASPKILIVDHNANSRVKAAAKEMQIPLFCLNEGSLEKYPDQNLSITSAITGTKPAYIMFTSGSTGSPKGVLISHSNILSFIDWSTKRYNISAEDIFVQVSPTYFDNSVFDFYTALFSGASLAPIKREIMKNPLELVQYIDRLKCTVFFSVPSLFLYLTTTKVLSEKVLKTIRIFTFGGEGYPISELKKLYQLYGQRAQFINVYGPTECSCICSSYDISAAELEKTEHLPPLGSINKNFEYLLLNDKNEEVKTGETGELYLLGPNVGIGYYNNSDQTKKAFISNPYQKNYFEKMYATGDLVRKDENNLLWFVGRKDNQIKHMGYRIELEEIENALNSLSFISQSAAIYKRQQTSYGKIIAFVSANEQVEENDIKKLLQDKLPSYMIPNTISLLDHLPKNPNGKVDKNYLKQHLGD